MGTDSENKETPKELNSTLSTRKWLVTMSMCSVPIIGWFVMIVQLLKRNTDSNIKAYCKSELIYRTIYLVVAIVIVCILVQIGASMLDVFLKQTMGA